MRRDAVAVGGRLVRVAGIGIVAAVKAHISRAVTGHIVGSALFELQAHANRLRGAHVARLVVGSIRRHQVGRVHVVVRVEGSVPALLTGSLLVIIFGGFEIAGDTRGLAHTVVVGISYLAIVLVAKQVAAYRRILRIAAPVRLGAAEHAIIGVVGLRRASARTRADDSREHQKALGVFHRSHGRLSVGADVLVVGARGGDTGGSLVYELVDFVVGVTVIDVAALAKGIAVDHAANVRVIVLVILCGIFLNGLVLFVLCTTTPRGARVAENHAATRNGTNITADGNKVRVASNGKAVRCRTVIWIVYDHAINNVIAAKNAADNATEKRCRNAVLILIRISNSRLRIHIVDVEIAHHAAIAIGNETAKLALVIFNLNCCRPR